MTVEARQREGGKSLLCLQFCASLTGRKRDPLEEGWCSGSPYWLPGILEVDTNYLILWEKRRKIACLLFYPFLLAASQSLSPALLLISFLAGLENLRWLLWEKAQVLCKLCLRQGKLLRGLLCSQLLATDEWEKEVIMEKLWQVGETESDSPFFRGVGHLCSTACSCQCWIIYSSQEGDTEGFFWVILFFSLCISVREILFEMYFVWFQGKKYSHWHSWELCARHTCWVNGADI